MIKYFTLFMVAIAGFSFYVKKDKPFLPPGTVRINGNLFADECEITNFSWQEYEQWTKTKYGKNSEEHLKTLPDTLVWINPLAYNAPFVKYYYRHPAYKDYPVVGISYEQAVAFCRWRTERVKEYFYITKKKACDITYRLPTKAEWELISNNGTDIFSNNGKTEKGLIKLNCQRDTDSIVSSITSPDVTAPAYSYWKNRFGLFNTIGNVAEMVLDKGISKGGSWRHRFEECRAGKDIAYSKPEAWLGFRCVCEVKM